MGFLDLMTHAWSMFPRDPTDPEPSLSQMSTDEPRTLAPMNAIPTRRYGRASVVSMLYNRIAMDVSAIKFNHVKLDETREKETVVESSLQRLFTVEANIDQSSTDFFHDLVFSLFDEGVVAAVPIEADLDPVSTGSYNIKSMRVGKVMEWFPTKVRVRVYNEFKGNFSEIVVPKKMTAIIENPLGNLIGDSNPTLDRLLAKMALLDKQDTEYLNNKMNLIIQLPHPVRTDIKKAEAEKRVKALEDQLNSSNYGIAYAGVEEKITQLNRPLNNNLLEEVKYLFDQLLNQMGVTPNVFNGTANQAEMQAYHTRIIEPIATRIAEEFQRKFITKTAYTQGHRITTYTDPFKLVPTEQLASIGDALLRNSILTPNEFRAIIGFGPNSNPLADELYNRNIADANQNMSIGEPQPYPPEEEQHIPPEEEEYRE